MKLHLYELTTSLSEYDRYYGSDLIMHRTDQIALREEIDTDSKEAADKLIDMVCATLEDWHELNSYRKFKEFRWSIEHRGTVIVEDEVV